VTGFHRFATIEQRQFDILLRRSAGEQVEALKDKTEAIAPQQGALVAVEPFNVDAAKAIFAGGRAIEAAEQVHRRRFTGTARPHHRDEIAGLNGEINPAQRLKCGLTLTVSLGDAAQFD
jgi:hypothetical protein